MGAEVFDHVIHLCIQGVRSKHVAVLFADFLDALENGLVYAEIAVGSQLMNQSCKKLRPLLLDILASHKRNHFEEKVGENTLAFATEVHHNVDELTHQNLLALLVYHVVGVILIKKFALVLLCLFGLLVVVSVAMGSEHGLNLILEQNCSQLAVLIGSSIVADVLE